MGSSEEDRDPPSPPAQRHLERADRLPTDPATIEALSEELPPEPMLGEILAQAVAQGRARAFTNTLLAALHAQRSVDAGWIAAGGGLLPGVGVLAVVAGHLDGDVAQALLRGVRSRRLGAEREPVALLLAECWARRSGAERPEGLISEARIRSRRSLSPQGLDALIALSVLVDDPHLDTLLADLITEEARASAQAFAEALVDHLVGSVHDALAPQAPEPSPRPVRRAAPKLSRNAPCWCGSGRKHKLCHEGDDRARLADSSDVEGLTTSELSAQLEAHLTPERLIELSGHVLARLDATAIDASLRPLLVEQLCQWGELDAAVALLEACWGRALAASACLVAEQAARLGRADLIERIVALRPEGGAGLVLEARLLLLSEPGAWLAQIEADARQELDARGVDLGLGLIAAGLPALGVHVARGQLALRSPDAHSDALRCALLEARDALLRSPWDPIDDVLYLLERGVAPELGLQLRHTRAQLDHSEAALAATQDALAALRAELQRREARPPVEEPRPRQDAPQPDQGELITALRGRVARLRQDLKQRHQERNALRRELEATRAQAEQAEPPSAPPPAQPTRSEPAPPGAQPTPSGVGHPGAGDHGHPTTTSVRIPSFPERFSAQLSRIPAATSRAAMARLGELCAGYAHAFRDCRPLRGVEGVWRARIGRSYRLLFRLEPGTLVVLGLVHRQDLDTHLSQLKTTP